MVGIVFQAVCTKRNSGDSKMYLFTPSDATQVIVNLSVHSFRCNSGDSKMYLFTPPDATQVISKMYLFTPLDATQTSLSTLVMDINTLFHYVLEAAHRDYEDKTLLSDITRAPVLCMKSNLNNSSENVVTPPNRAEQSPEYNQAWNTRNIPFFVLIIIVPLINMKSPVFFTKFNSLGKRFELQSGLWKPSPNFIYSTTSIPPRIWTTGRRQTGASNWALTNWALGRLSDKTTVRQGQSYQRPVDGTQIVATICARPSPTFVVKTFLISSFISLKLVLVVNGPRQPISVVIEKDLLHQRGVIALFYLMLFVTVKASQWGVNVDLNNTRSTHFTPIFQFGFPALSGMLSMALSSHVTIITVMRNNKRQDKNIRDLQIGYFLGAFTYLYIGILFYISFPGPKHCIKDNLLNNFKVTDPMACVGRGCLLFQMTTNCILLSYAVRRIVLFEIFHNVHRSHVWHGTHVWDPKSHVQSISAAARSPQTVASDRPMDNIYQN
uniref:Uncharacterized protein n=1 Tax=Timema bartmani TaxID=61472 RepID=A0A7R9I236_9NEOP|nr:unnamed protein product [Timema bartmani]